MGRLEDEVECRALLYIPCLEMSINTHFYLQEVISDVSLQYLDDSKRKNLKHLEAEVLWYFDNFEFIKKYQQNLF